MISRMVAAFALLLCAAVTPAKATVIYDFTWGGSFSTATHWAFETPTILTTTTTINAIDLLPGASSNRGIIDHITIFNPFSTNPQIDTSIVGGSGSHSDFGFDLVAPFNHLGAYTSRSGSVLVIRETASVPEPTTYLLMLAGLGLIGFTTLRKQGATA